MPVWTWKKGESEETRIEWDCKEIQRLLNRHNESSRHLEAKDLIAKCVTVKTQKSEKKNNESFFRVEMVGVKDKLLDSIKVKTFLEEVAPLPFETAQFHFGNKIDEWLRKEVTDYQTYRIFLNDSLLKKRYCRTLPIRGKHDDELTGFDKFNIQDRQEKVIARGWLGLRRDNLGAILPASGCGSLRVRVGNILIGDASLLNSCFSGSDVRFNRYLVGKIHIITRDLVPNGRRDDFQDSEMKTDFFAKCGKICRSAYKENPQGLGT